MDGVYSYPAPAAMSGSGTDAGRGQNAQRLPPVEPTLAER
jgi:hypothetical protein